MSRGEQIRRRLESAETLGTVVTTMKTLASVRIGQYRRAVRALEASARTLDLATQALVMLYPELLEAHGTPVGRSLTAVVFGSDRGLAGPYNERISRHADGLLRARTPEGERATLVAVGRRMASRLRGLGRDVEHEIRPPGNLETVDGAVMDVLAHIDALRAEEKAGRLLLVHARPTTAAQYEPRVVQVLPVDTAWLRSLRHRPWPTNRLPMPISDGTRLLHAVVRQRIAHELVRAFAASQASENAARLAAMDAAERNIDERRAQLRTAYQQERQNAVTEELLDIQAAYAATGDEVGG
jgi:F-type H+-transporting ATPase subunit gamma